MILSLLILPVQGASVQEVRGFAAHTLQMSAAPLQSFSALYNWLFGARKAQRQKLSLTDRIAMVSSLRLSPAKFVGYVGDTLALNALPLDASGKTVQGVRLSWESSSVDKLQIDDTGVARLLQPGQVRVICRTGSAETSVPVLIRPGNRPPQTHAEWDEDQARLTEAGTVIGETVGGDEEHHEVVVEEVPVDGAADSSDQDAPFANTIERDTVDAVEASSILSRSSARLVEALSAKTVPAAYAQSNGCMALGDSTDFGYDELYSDPRNLVGSPRYRAMEGVNMGSVLPEGSNFELAVPLYSLSGRGPGINLALFYNSRVWSRHGSAVTYNAVNGFPFAGFSLGFGRILTYGSGANTKYVLIDADGTRHYLGTGSDTTTTTYETTDGTHITFVGSKTGGGSLYYNNGTKVTITVYNNLLLPTRIRDANGNYISIGYKPYNSFSFPWRQAIDSITDTLGRYITFGYDSFANLTSITVPALDNGTQTLVQFDYQCNTVSNSFSGLTVENRPTSTVPMLRHIYFPATQTGYKFDYSAYGMIYKTTLRKDMSIDVDGVIADGTQKAAIEYNYPTVASSLTDAPSFSQRVESATNAPTSTYTYSSSTGSGTKTFTITRPDSSKLVLTRSTTGATDGLLTETQIQNSSSTTMAKSVMTYTTDGGSNKQVQSVTTYDDLTPTANQTKVDFDYDSYGNITNKREYGFQISGNWQVRRRSRTVYKTDTAYINAYLRSLVIEINLYNARENTNDTDDEMLAKTTVTYDDYNAMSGMEVYTGQAEAPNHETAFGAGVTVRGNVTGVTQYKDVAASQTIARLKKYDKYGNVVKEQLSCCNEVVLSMDQTNGYAVPVEETRGSGSTTLTSSIETDFNTGLIWKQTDAGGKETTYTYDAANRIAVVTSLTGATSGYTYNDSNLTVAYSMTYTENGSTKTVSTTSSDDGWGRIVSTVDAGGGQVNITYDAMGRMWKLTNPFQVGQTPGAQTVNTFDALGRTTLVTFPDNNMVQTSYSGATVTVTDQVNRKMKRESDGLGRLIKVTEQDSSTGNLTQETSYTYDLMNNLTEVNQGSQYRKFTYDSLGRLTYEKIPEQGGTVNDGHGTYYTYTDFNAVLKRTDGRGVETNYSYDTMNRLTGISYNVSGASGVAATPSVTYNYDNTESSATKGLLLSVSISGQSSESYSYDTNKQLSGITRTIGTKTYTTSYQRTTAGQLTQLTYPSNRVLNINYDAAARLSSIVNNGDSTNYLSGISYNYAGQVTGETLGSNINQTFGYDANRLQLTSQTVTQNSQTRLSLSYNYNASAGQNGTGSTAGNSGQLMSISGSIGGQTESASYTYDLSSRLVTSNQTTNGVSAQRRFMYDRWGNRTGVYNATSGGTQIQSISLELSSSIPTNRIASVTNNGGTPVNYTYDANGNVTNDGGAHSYQYDAENRIVSVDSGATATYAYDHQNRRIKKVVGASVTHYVWEGGQCIAEHNGSTGAVLTDYIFAGSRMIAREQSGNRHFFLNDRLGARATITDGQGGIIGRQATLPFGEELNATGTTDKHKLANYERESETGNDYAVNRGYAPSTGRFNQSDPYKASGGVADPQSWNRYTYARNDSINLYDPLGLSWSPVYIPPFLRPQVVNVYAGPAVIDAGAAGGAAGVIDHWRITPRLTEGEPRRGERGEEKTKEALLKEHNQCMLEARERDHIREQRSQAELTKDLGKVVDELPAELILRIMAALTYAVLVTYFAAPEAGPLTPAVFIEKVIEGVAAMVTELSIELIYKIGPMLGRYLLDRAESMWTTWQDFQECHRKYYADGGEQYGPPPSFPDPNR